MNTKILLSVLMVAAFVVPLRADTNTTFTIATYNVENWNKIERRGKPNEPKPSWERAAVVNVMTNFHPDVIAFEEMGNTNDLAELHNRLRAKGMDFPYREWLQATDTDRHVAILSRFPIVANHSRTNDTYQLGDHPEPIQRGILDVTIQVNSNYAFRAVVVHLKSKRTIEFGDQAKMRLEEARLLRAHIAGILRENPKANVVVLGDFNDTPDSDPIRALLGDKSLQLFPLPARDSAGTDSTHFWKFKKEYSHIDYIMVSPGMSNEFVTGSARIADYPGWNKGSDHRPVFGRFVTEDK
jgi:endonuclease/exonuclease/phosphatase family metal-dependent hydrolase